jgi:hypothetical protein
MGMGLCGLNPAPQSGETGRYFRNNIWWWHPLADYCMEVAPDIAEKCSFWHSNDGDGLNAEDSVELARRLKSAVDRGNARAYAKRCKEAGRLFDIENVKAWIAFLEVCGGFEIW